MESFSVQSRADFSSCGRMQGGTGFLELAKIAKDEAIRDSRAYKLKPW